MKQHPSGIKPMDILIGTHYAQFPYSITGQDSLVMVHEWLDKNRFYVEVIRSSSASKSIEEHRRYFSLFRRRFNKFKDKSRDEKAMADFSSIFPIELIDESWNELFVLYDVYNPLESKLPVPDPKMPNI